MMTAQDQEVLSFDTFRERVGYPEHRVRAALLALRLQPVPMDPTDMRRKGYPAAWVPTVQEWLRAAAGF